jgi:hypothetical protein
MYQVVYPFWEVIIKEFPDIFAMFLQSNSTDIPQCIHHDIDCPEDDRWTYGGLDSHVVGKGQANPHKNV